MHIQPVAVLTLGALGLLLIASPASAAWVCTAHNHAGQKWTITRPNRAVAAAMARLLCAASGANGGRCVTGCQGDGWGARSNAAPQDESANFQERQMGHIVGVNSANDLGGSWILVDMTSFGRSDAK
jgi:hypothetical protein